MGERKENRESKGALEQTQRGSIYNNNDRQKNGNLNANLPTTVC